MRAPDLEDRMEAAVAEPRGDPRRELEGRAQELPPLGVAVLVEIIGDPGVGIREAEGLVDVSLVDVLGRQDVAIAGEAPVEVFLFEEDLERVALADVADEIDVPAEAPLDEIQGEDGLLAGLVDGRDEVRLDRSPDQGPPDLEVRISASIFGLPFRTRR
jgi:hypothetical protein